MLIFKKKSRPMIRRLLALMLPIITSQAAIVGMNFFDTAMSGKYGAADLAGVAAGSNLWMIVLTSVSGILMAAMPLIANLLGKGGKTEVTAVVRKGLCLGFVFDVILLSAGITVVPLLLGNMGLEPRVYDVAIGYLIAIAFGVPAIFASVLLRSFVDTLGHTTLSMKIFLFALPVNALLNYCFIFGAFGVPEFGGAGAGITTSATYWLILFMYVYNVCRRSPFKEYGIFAFGTSRYETSEKTAGQINNTKSISYLEYLRIGIPLGLSIMLETSVFSITAFLVAKFGTTALAAHQAAVNFSTLIYMVPMGFSMAATILIGYEYGGKNYQAVRDYIRICLEMSCTIGIVYIIIEIFACHQIAALYSNDVMVTELVAQLILLACIWQMGDMLSAPCQGITRGMKDVNATLIASGIAYWLICLPVGYILDYGFNIGLYSYWLSLDAGVLVSAFVILLRLRYDMKTLLH